MRKNLSREGGKKFVYDNCQRPTFFWQKISSRASEWTQGFTFLDNCNYSKVRILRRSSATPAEGLCVTLLYLTF